MRVDQDLVVKALVDTGCTQSILSKRLLDRVTVSREKAGRTERGAGAPTKQERIAMVDGSEVSCSVAEVMLAFDRHSLMVRCLVLENLLPDFELILGMDVIGKVGGLSLGGATGEVQFGLVAKSEEQALSLEDVDFTADFDGNRWIVKWKWTGEEPRLSNQVPGYRVKKHLQDKFDAEVESWIEDGILLPVPASESVDSVIPLMAVEQASKGKVRPVLDFKELNQYIACHTGGSAVCEEAVRRWRRMGVNLALLDLRKAYLQLHIDPVLWKHQIVSYKGRYFYLSRLGFGLNSAPRIMSRILEKVLSLNDKIQSGTDNYLDDILVNEDVVSAEEVSRHLARFGLEAKPPERIGEGGKVLGLAVKRSGNGGLCWGRAMELPSSELPPSLTRRELFSICGQLVGHNPVAGPLRIACSFIKRQSEGHRWDDEVGVMVRKMLSELLEEVRSSDPVGGRWEAPSDAGRIWCDASSLAMGCALEIDGNIVEDAAWMRKKDDGGHINMAELDAVLKGMNLAVKWKMKKIEIVTDSATVFAWLNATFFDVGVIRTRGMNEMLVRRRLSVVKEMCKEFELEVAVKWVESHKNKADCLTRVKRKWLQAAKEALGRCCAATKVDLKSAVRRVHNQHHLGIERTLFLAKKMDPEVSKALVTKIVEECPQCASIDPAPVRWESGSLDVSGDWIRLAADVTHYNGRCYLSVVDCGPSRFTIWRELSDESSMSIVPQFRQIFRERGPPEELLLDNGSAFRSSALSKLLDSWCVKATFRCAYRPSGNSIVERNHRTIKRMAARTNGDPLDMVFYYNSTPKVGTREETVPSAGLHRYEWRMPGISATRSLRDSELDRRFACGEEVYVKPPAARCTSLWPKGRVTDQLTSRSVEVNGIPRHVGDVRRVPTEDNSSEEDTDEKHQGEEERIAEESVRPQRDRRRPDFYGNNVYDF